MIICDGRKVSEFALASTQTFPLAAAAETAMTMATVVAAPASCKLLVAEEAQGFGCNHEMTGCSVNNSCFHMLPQKQHT